MLRIKNFFFVSVLIWIASYTGYAYAVLPPSLQLTPGVSLFMDVGCARLPPDRPYNYNMIYYREDSTISYFSLSQNSEYRINLNGHSYVIPINPIIDQVFSYWGRVLNTRFVRSNNPNENNNIVIDFDVQGTRLPSLVMGIGAPRVMASAYMTPTIDYNHGRLLFASENNLSSYIQNVNRAAIARSLFEGSDDHSFILTFITFVLMHEIGHVLGFSHSFYDYTQVSSRAVPITSPDMTYPTQPSLMVGSQASERLDGFLIYLETFKDYYQRTVNGPDDIKANDEEINTMRQLPRPYSQSFGERRSGDAKNSSDTCPEPYKGVSDAITTSGIFKDNPSWVDVNGDGAQDFCTVDGSNLKCYINNNGDFSKKALDYNPGFDLGWADTRSFIKGGINENKERLTAFCRGYGSNSFRCDYFRFDKNREELVYSFQKTIDYTDLGWTDGRVGLDDGSRQSDRRWYVDLEGQGIQSYCRLVGIGDTSLACWLNKGKDGYARDIWSTGMGQLNNSGNVFGWIKYKNSVALCWTYFDINVKVVVKCMPYNNVKSKFENPVEFNMITDYVKGGTGRFIYKYVDNGYEPQSGAYCFVNRNGKWNCKVLGNEEIPVVEYGSLPNNDAGWADSIGFTTFPGSSYPGACSLVGTWTLQCQTFVYEYDKSINAIFPRSDSMQGFGIDGGYASIYDGNRRWMRFGDMNSLFCRKTGGDNMTCNQLYYGFPPN